MTSQTSARTALKSATQSYHDRVDGAFSTAHLKDRSSYTDFLRAQAGAYLAAEDALERGGIAQIVPDWRERRRSDMLRADLADLGAEPPAPVAEVALDGEAALLGTLYVLEGSRLGGTLLKRSVPEDFPSRFLSGADSAAWRRLIALLDERLDDEEKRATSIKAACDMFMLFEASARRFIKGD